MIETVNLAEFSPLVQIYAPDAPWPIVMANLRRSAIEFCTRTRCWRQTLNLDITHQDERIILPKYAAIHEIEAARFNNDVELEHIAFPDASKWPSVGQPRFITQQNPNTVRLIPFETGELAIDVFLKPVEGIAFPPVAPDGYREDQHDAVPRFLYTNHAEAIAAGALARMLVIPNQSFTNPELAGLCKATFEQAANEHAGHNIRGQQRAPVRSRPNFF